ncbi:MAG: M23 family metallopeptidase [Oscillospiraceae bacterium]|jgi:murein DD-endopeptidase MepM/ murein hydrolase activator NlpD|nr:M23 family metallopeptidase [Oscillospiraceae bacterium]
MKEENNQETQGKKKFKTTKGFYIAVAVCLLVIGGATFSTFLSVRNLVSPQDSINLKLPEKNQENVTNSQTDESRQEDNASKEAGAQPRKHHRSKEDKKDVPAAPRNNDHVERPKSDFKQSAEVAVGRKPDDGLVDYPVSKNVIKPFSDAPIHSKTMLDWRTHNGIDLEAEKASDVKTIANGKVRSISKDEIMGITVVIEHPNGVLAYYSGLDENTDLKEGSQVKLGQKIGTVGVIPSESEDKSHIHLGIQKDGKWINPIDILGS